MSKSSSEPKLCSGCLKGCPSAQLLKDSVSVVRQYMIGFLLIRIGAISLLYIVCKIVQNQGALQGNPRSFCENLRHCCAHLRKHMAFIMLGGQHPYWAKP